MATVPGDEALPPNYKQYPDGSLLRIVFHNFLTYEHCSFIPSENLNMILGHNGSGKSSIICGICLACGGSPKSLGRSEKIVDYIRHGCIEGYVEIAIADEQKGPQTVRLILRVGKAPEYRLNNAVATQSDITSLRKHYNIQIDNPCAFLAQDKVKSFSEQSSIELLQNTEKAASEDLDQRHRLLIEDRKDSTTIEEKCISSDKAVKNLENEIQKLMPLVENYRKKMAMQSKLRLLEKKKKILEFQVAEEEYKEEVLKVDEALEEYRELEKKIDTSETKKAKFQERARIERERIAELQRSANSILGVVQANTNKKMIETMVGNAKSQLENVKKRAEQHEHELKKTENKIEASKAKLVTANEDFAGHDDFLAEQKNAERRWNESAKQERIEEDEIRRLQYEVKTIEAKHQNESKETDQNLRDRKFDLNDYNSDALKAYNHYLSHKNEFKGPIYMVAMDMVYKTPEAQKLLENSLPSRERAMFVCTTREDEFRINNDKTPWKISTAVVLSERINLDEINATIPPDLKKQGFQCFVSETFDAPPALKQYCCNVAGLHNIPYGKIPTEKFDDVVQLLDKYHMDVFMTHMTRVQVKRSIYSRGGIQSQTAMRNPFYYNKKCYLVAPVQKTKANFDRMSERIQELRAEIKSRSEALHEKRTEIQKEKDRLRKSSLEWTSKRQVVNKWKTDVVTETNRLKDLQRETFDIEEAEREFQEAEKKAIEKTKVMLEKHLKGQRDYIEKYRELGRCHVIYQICKARVAKFGDDAEELRERLISLKHLKDQAENQVRALLNKLRVARSNMTAECELQHLDEAKMTPIEKKVFSKLNQMFIDADLPTDIDGLAEMIVTETTRLKLAEDSGEDGSKEHENKMTALNMELATETAKREKLVENREGRHKKLGDEISKWKEEVEKMIELINENYIKFFETLGCRGEVSLDIPENHLDIEKYGIMIMVCFRRGENMKRLDNKVQSGGERSVATMLYLLALQQLCPVPFRCIDEINQGMDPTNERKVFDIMVGLWNGTSGTLSKTQYFLLSPKLLHGLDMRDNVNIVMVNSTLTNAHGKMYDTNSKLDATFSRLGLNA